MILWTWSSFFFFFNSASFFWIFWLLLFYILGHTVGNTNILNASDSYLCIIPCSEYVELQVSFDYRWHHWGSERSQDYKIWRNSWRSLCFACVQSVSLLWFATAKNHGTWSSSSFTMALCRESLMSFTSDAFKSKPWKTYSCLIFQCRRMTFEKDLSALWW